MKPSYALVVIFLMALPAFGQGQESLSLTLPEALRLARERNPDLLAARQELEIARGRAVKARYPSQFNPELGSEVTNRSRGEPGEHGSSVDFAVTLSQEVEIGGQRGKRIDEAERNLALVTQRGRDRDLQPVQLPSRNAPRSRCLGCTRNGRWGGRDQQGRSAAVKPLRVETAPAKKKASA